MGKVKKHKARGPYEAFFKRPLDFVLAAFSIIILSPLILLLALAVRLKIGSPVLFSQERPGRIDPESGKEKIIKSGMNGYITKPYDIKAILDKLSGILL